MPRKRNNLGQFIAQDSYSFLFIEIPGPLKIFKYFLILIVLFPWIFVLLLGIDIKSNFKKLIEFIFGFNEGELKKTKGFF